jgi:hypothetical protein
MIASLRAGIGLSSLSPCQYCVPDLESSQNWTATTLVHGYIDDPLGYILRNGLESLAITVFPAQAVGSWHRFTEVRVG